MNGIPNAVSAAALHPVLWVAGISGTLLSLAGIAALSGLLPLQTVSAPERPAIVAAAQASEPPPAVVAPVAQVVVPPASTLPAGKTIPVVRHKTANKRVAEETPMVSPPLPSLPPPLAGGVPPDYVPPAPSAPAALPPCPDCGVIDNVRQVTHEGQTSGAGAIVGGLAGGALANSISRGSARTLATIAGAVGGGMLGNSIEKSQRTTVGYQVAVRMEDGATRLIDSDTLPPWRIGDSVKLVDGAIVSR